MLEFFHKVRYPFITTTTYAQTSKIKSRLDNTTLSRIWALSDVNEDGFLNHGEFITAMHLIVLHLKVGWRSNV